MDICHALKRAIEYSASGIENLGTGFGYTVQTIVDCYQQVNNTNFEVQYLPRRSGDAERTVLDNPSSYMLNSYVLEEMVRK